DHHRAGAADALAAIVIERDRIVAGRDQLLVQYVEHFQERHVRADIIDLIVNESPNRFRVFLPPDLEMEFHIMNIIYMIAWKDARLPMSIPPDGGSVERRRHTPRRRRG